MHDHLLDHCLMRRVIIGVALLVALLLLIGRSQFVLGAGLQSGAPSRERALLYLSQSAP